MARGVKMWHIADPITDRRIHPDTKPPKSPRPTKLKIWGSPGQYEPASFVLWSPRQLDNVRIEATDLKCGRNRIRAAEIDLRIVKCWYMAGLGVWAESKKGGLLQFDATADGDGVEQPETDLWLEPELMVKDDYLIDVDQKRQTNIFRFTGLPTDAKTLQPFKLKAGESLQIWLTVRIPEDTPAGRYEGEIKVKVPRGGSMVVPLTAEVLPIELSDPSMQYMLYYDSKLTARWNFTTAPHHRTATQMLAELKDMRAHGITNTTVSEWVDGDKPDGKHFDFSRIDQVMDLREKAGFPVRNQPLYWHGGPNMLCGHYKHDAWSIDQKTLDGVARTTKAMLRWAKRRGIPELHVYGIDEVQQKRLKQEIRAFKMIRSLGAKVFVAVMSNYHDYLGDMLDCAIMNGDPKKIPQRVIRRIHSTGGRCYNYGFPQGGECRPHTYRRNYGLYLLETGMDGPCPYAYMCMPGRYQAYNRIHTSHGPWLHHLMSFPTEDGVIPTWGWEGWRAAADDVRYVTTLRKLVDAGEGAAQQRSAARKFLKSLDPDGNLAAQRRQCARQILALTK